MTHRPTVNQAAENRQNGPPTLMVTQDGSHTVRLAGSEVTYHSHYGALAESQHVFIQAGLQFVLSRKQTITLLEVGLGTGLNALLTLLALPAADATVDYWALEPDPLPDSLIAELNYPRLLGEHLAPVLRALHAARPGQAVSLERMRFTRLATGWPTEDLPAQRFDLCYFDAFAPNDAPALWTRPGFEALARVMRPGGVVVTFSARGQVRRDLIASGFVVERLPGGRGKREMLRAIRRE